MYVNKGLFSWLHWVFTGHNRRPSNGRSLPTRRWIEELGSRFLRPREVQHALCSVAVQLGHLQREHEMLGPKGNREQVFFRGILDIV